MSHPRPGARHPFRFVHKPGKAGEQFSLPRPASWCYKPRVPTQLNLDCEPLTAPRGNSRLMGSLVDVDGTCAIVPHGCLELGCAKIPAPCPLPPGQKVVHEGDVIATKFATVHRRCSRYGERSGDERAYPRTWAWFL